MIKRLTDIAVALLLLILFSPVLLLIFALIKFSSFGPVFYWSVRIGRDNSTFRMPKFRTMRIDTPEIASHLLLDPEQYLTTIGKFLRKMSLDELPQLYSILKGDMTFVGPRPALFNQGDLIKLRTNKGVHLLTPGLTGWAQINGRDELPIPMKVEYDTYYLNHQSFCLDLRIIILTILKVARREGVSH